MALFLQAVRLAKLRTAPLYFRVLNPIGSFSKIDRDWHELDIMAHDTSAERSRHMRIVPPRDHNNTWTCAPTWSPQGEPMRTGPEPTRSPAWNGWSARSPHATTPSNCASDCRLRIRCASTTNWHMSGTVLGIRLR